MSRFLVLGAGGLIGRAVVAALPPAAVRALSHQAADDRTAFRNVEAVLFAGRDPGLASDDFRPEETMEAQAARLASEIDVPFLSLGTGRVYAPSPAPWTETSSLGPTSTYGHNKLRLEQRLLDQLGPRLTRLRIANVFGYEPGHGTFMGRMLEDLRTKDQITFDMSPFTRRDFLPVEVLGQWLAALLHRPPGGIVNIGSGLGLACGHMALWLIESYGKGQLTIKSPVMGEEFVMDIAHLREMADASITVETLRASVMALGVRLQQTGA